MNYQITIDGDICRWGYSKQWLREELAKYKGKHVDLRISSLGGDAGHGLDMRQQLADHGDVTVYLTGFIASAATVIAMGAKRICMSKYAMFLVHKCSNFVDAWGYYNADQMTELIQQLESSKRENDKLDVILAQVYADRCKKKVGDILDVLKKAEWLTAEEALNYGFIDEITEADSGKINFTDDLRSKFCAYGLPTPQFEIAEDAPKSMLAQILNAIRSLTSCKPTQNHVEPEPEPQPEPVMNQTTAYAALMAAIAVDSLQASADGSVTLTQAQLEKLEAAISQLNASLEERNQTVADLNQKVEELKQMPADTTQQAHQDAETYMSTDEVYNLIKDI